MKNENSNAWLIISLLLSIGFIFFFYGKIFIAPNQFQFSNKGDAIKNYYTYAYYINNNSDLINFSGLNYPYGEHFLYTDCTPILSITIKSLTYFIPELSNYSVGILNFLLIVSFIVSSLFIFLILRELKVNLWLASLGALGIMVLSPQVFRLTGHLALGFGFFIPLTWYLLLKYEQNRNLLKYPILLLVSVLLLFFIHAYLGMITASFLLSYLIIWFLINFKSRKKDKRYYYILSTIVFFPIILFRLFIFLTDTHYGRTDNPWGFFVAHADLKTVFLPNHRPLKPFIENLTNPIQQTWEGWAYIGIASVAVILFYLILFIKKSIKYKKLNLDNRWFNNSHLQVVFLSSIILLIFSMAYPFRFNLEWLLDYATVLKQFRAVGRFAWVFYFATTISSVYIVDRLSKHYFTQNKKITAYILIIFLPCTYLVEGIPYHIDMSENLSASSNMFDFEQLDEPLKYGINNINKDDYQAILPLPFFYIGSENYGKIGTDKIYLLSQVISFHTGLPILGSYLTRTSIWESKRIMQVLSPNFYKKEIISDLTSDKPFLIVFSNENLSIYEKQIIDHSSLIFSAKDYSFYLLKTNDLFNNTAQDEYNIFNQIKNELYKCDGFLTNDTSSFLFYNDFEEKPSDITFRGIGAFSGLKRNYNKLASIKGGVLMPEEKYIASFWMYNQGENFGQDMLNSMFFVQEKHDDLIEWTTLVNPMNSMTINGDWSLIEMEFNLKHPNSEIEFFLKGDDLSNKYIYIDDFIIYKSGTMNYKVESGDENLINILFKNNHRIIVN